MIDVKNSINFTVFTCANKSWRNQRTSYFPFTNRFNASPFKTHAKLKSVHKSNQSTFHHNFFARIFTSIIGIEGRRSDWMEQLKCIFFLFPHRSQRSWLNSAVRQSFRDYSNCLRGRELKFVFSGSVFSFYHQKFPFYFSCRQNQKLQNEKNSKSPKCQSINFHFGF